MTDDARTTEGARSASEFASLEGVRVKDEHLLAVLAGTERLVEDGAMGTMLQASGLLAPGALPDLLSLSHPEAITAIHAAYVEAGAELLTTNTFRANRRQLPEGTSVAEVYAAAVGCARAAGARYVAGDIGPTGELLEPYGDLEHEEAYELFAEQARAASAAGADLVVIETMADLAEAELAVRAAREACDLPVFATMTFAAGGRTMFGASPEDAVGTLVAAGAHAVGVNCSLGPDELLPIAERMLARAACPVILKPNAGLPRMEGGQTVYDVTPEEFACAMERALEAGVTIVGGCCGTSPAFIKELVRRSAC